MSTALVRALYATLLRLLLPLYFARLWWRGFREPPYRRHWGERLGGGAQPPDEGGRIWVHAVSLGETRAAAALLKALRRRIPGARFLLTHGTATGRDAGAALLEPGDLQAWAPYDTPGAVLRFLRRHQPLVGVLMETEIWPNLLHIAREAGLPMVLANARLSERSARRHARLPSLMRPALASLTRVIAQTDADARRLLAAGARQALVLGNLKYDMTPPPRLLARGIEWRQPLPREVVLAAVTREGEEQRVLQRWREVPEPRPLLVIVPRHPQRFDAVARLVEDAGFTLARRSAWGDTPPPEAATADCWLGDSLGEMPLYYAMSDAALLGGSFAPRGGQNLIEAAACGCPLVMGPHTFNFAHAAELSIAAGAAVRVADLKEGVPCVVALARDPHRNERVQQALDFAAQHRGAAERMADVIGALLVVGRG